MAGPVASERALYRHTIKRWLKCFFSCYLCVFAKPHAAEGGIQALVSGSRQEQARRSITRLLERNPALRVSDLKDVLGPYRRAEDAAKITEGLRRAGLPD